MSFEPIRAKGLPPLPKIKQIAILVDDENYSQVDLYAQIILRELPSDPHANLACAWVAKHFNLKSAFDVYFEKANNADRAINNLAADLHINLDSLHTPFTPVSTKIEHIKNQNLCPQFHLIKAWGFGFGSEMASLMGQTYLAEITGRTPVVHWGKNFLYRGDGTSCVFHHFFKPFNDLSLNGLLELKPQNIFPPKWTQDNLLNENVAKREGSFSKMSALYYLNCEQTVSVADYYAGVINIQPWLPQGHVLRELNFDETYRYLAKKYLRPQDFIQTHADDFIRDHLSIPFLAVHARGSDKDEGYRAMTSIPMRTLEYVKKRLAAMPQKTKLFLMTDDEALLKKYQLEFGQRLVTTNSQRSSSTTGVHYDPNSDKRSAGQEMLIDMLIAAKATCFIGLGLSNPSQLICYFGNFSKENYILFGENRLKQFNTHLYKTVAVR